VQVALQVALPELDGAVDPIVMSGRDEMTGRAIALADRVEMIAGRAMKWANLRRKPRCDKKIAITIFSFPPDKGNIGTAAYLDVFASVHKVVQSLGHNGYEVKDLPQNGQELMQEILHNPDAMAGSPELNIAAKLIGGRLRKAYTLLSKRSLKSGDPRPVISTPMVKICWFMASITAMCLWVYSRPLAMKAIRCDCCSASPVRPIMALPLTTLI
jgi:hypothetical protein